MNEFILEKSEQNRIASIYLKDKQLFAPSIHCGYYSCLQKIIGFFIYFYPEIHEGSYKLEGKKGNTHSYYIREFSDILRNKFNKRDARDVKDSMFVLKQFRIESDYENVELKQVDIEKAHKLTADIHRLIKKYI